MKTFAFTSFLVTSLFLTAFGEDSTNHPYWPARESSWTRYQIFRILAHWNPQNRQLTVCSRYPVAHEAFVSNEWVTSPSIAPSFNEKFQYFPCNPDNGDTRGHCLGNIGFQFAVGGSWFIGEVGHADKGFLVAPPEPKLPYDPNGWYAHQCRLGGAPLRTVHQVLDSRSGVLKTWPMVTNFAVIGHYAWGPHPDCWWTSLQEGDGMNAAVYSYVFARGIGLVDFWYVNKGEFDSNNMAWGWEYYAVDWMP